MFSMVKRSSGRLPAAILVAAFLPVGMTMHAGAQQRGGGPGSDGSGGRESGGAQMIFIEDDGAVPSIMHFSMPDFADLRQPDFTKRDLPLFREKLILSEAQTAVIERLIVEYLEAFKQLTIDILPGGGSGPMRIELDGEGEEGDGPRALELMPAMGDFEELGDVAELIESDLMVEEGMPRQIGIGVDVRMTAPGPDGEPPVPAGDGAAPEAGVTISVQTPDGEELPEEVRKKLEAAAAEIARKMQLQIEDQMASGEQGAAGAGRPLPPGGISPEEMMKRQEEMGKAADEFRTAKATLRQKFVIDAQAGLTEQQIERWPALERTLYRERSLPKARLSGERTDLIKVLKSTDVTESARENFADELEAYEIALDAALRQRDAFLPTANKTVDEAIKASDPDKALATIDRATNLRMAVRAVNQQYAQVIGSKLSPEHAPAFEQGVLKASYPNVYGTTRGQRSFAAAKKIDELDEETLSVILELERAYLAELESHNMQIRQAIDKHEPGESRRGIEKLKAVFSGERQPGPVEMIDGQAEDDPIRQAFARRRELDARYHKSLTELLTPEQIAQLPKPPSHRSVKPLIIRAGSGGGSAQ